MFSPTLYSNTGATSLMPSCYQPFSHHQPPTNTLLKHQILIIDMIDMHNHFSAKDTPCFQNKFNHQAASLHGFSRLPGSPGPREPRRSAASRLQGCDGRGQARRDLELEKLRPPRPQRRDLTSMGDDWFYFRLLVSVEWMPLLIRALMLLGSNIYWLIANQLD